MDFGDFRRLPGAQGPRSITPLVVHLNAHAFCRVEVTASGTDSRTVKRGRARGRERMAEERKRITALGESSVGGSLVSLTHVTVGAVDWKVTGLRHPFDTI